MIKRVVDEATGQVLHDCLEAGCGTSWDGEPIPEKDRGPVPPPGQPRRTVEVVRTDAKGTATVRIREG